MQRFEGGVWYKFLRTSLDRTVVRPSVRPPPTHRLQSVYPARCGLQSQSELVNTMEVDEARVSTGGGEVRGVLKRRTCTWPRRWERPASCAPSDRCREPEHPPQPGPVGMFAPGLGTWERVRPPGSADGDAFGGPVATKAKRDISKDSSRE